MKKYNVITDAKADIRRRIAAKRAELKILSDPRLSRYMITAQRAHVEVAEAYPDYYGEFGLPYTLPAVFIRVDVGSLLPDIAEMATSADATCYRYENTHVQILPATARHVEKAIVVTQHAAQPYDADEIALLEAIGVMQTSTYKTLACHVR